MSWHHISRRGVGGGVTPKRVPLLLPFLLLVFVLLLHDAAGGDIRQGLPGGDDNAVTLLPLCAGNAGSSGEGDDSDQESGDSGSGDQDGGGGGGETGDEEKCVSPADRPLSWQDAHHFCRGLDGFLPSRDEYHLLGERRALPNATSLTWTALTPLHGHYQWLSRCPEYEFFSASTDFTVWREGRVPRAWDRSCAALDLATMEFQLTPCNTSLLVLCVLHSGSPAGVGEDMAEDVRLVVEADTTPGPEGNLSLTRDDFAKLGLTCTAYSMSTGQRLIRQPPVFWRKDLVYSGHCAASLVPATLHDPTKSPAALGTTRTDTLVTQQGTYWCEAWGPPGVSTRLVSNKVLLTLQDTVVFIVQAHRREGAVENVTESGAKDQLRNAFFQEMGNIQSYTPDLVAASKRLLPGMPPALLATYTFHLHVPREKIKSLWLTLEEALKFKARKLNKVLSHFGYENTSSVTFPELCLNHASTVPGEVTPDLEWPATFIGPVYPTNMRCEVPYGRLAAVGHCLWNYTHGARLVYKPHPCRWRDLCPEGYVAVAGRYCVTVRTSVSWEEGFQAVHTTSQEVSLLSNDVLQSHSEWRQMRQLMQDAATTDEVWLPDRRVRAGGPLQHLGPLPRAGYNLTHNITWAEGQPQPDMECLALNLSARTLHTRPCHTRLPFPALVKAQFLGRFTSWPKLSEESVLCRGWRSPTLRGTDEVCFNLFKGVGNLTWGEARAFCREQDADLPAPNIGFLDWVYRQELNQQGVEGVWMFPHWVPERVVYSGPADTRQDYLGWAVDTNYTLPYGELTPRGWLLRGNETRQDVLCQRLLRTTERLSLKVLPPAASDAGSLCVKVDPLEMLAAREKHDFTCYVNGRPARFTDQSLCVAEVVIEGPGYYQCLGWTVAPVTLVASNSLLQAPASLTFLVTLLEPEARYNPLLHDATFIAGHFAQPGSCGCCEALSAALSNSQVERIECLTAARHHYLAGPDGRLLHGLHVECRGVASTQDEPQVLETLTSVLAPGRQVGVCTVHDIRGTQGCDREVTVDEGKQGTRGNLTWPATVGARQVVPEEPCVTPSGEPVTRECVGDFLLGYQWGPAGHCTGTVSNLTRELWLASREARDSLNKTEAALAANISALQPVDIFLVAKSLEAAAESPPPDLSLAQLVSVMDSVLAADAAAFLPVQQRLGSSDTLLTAFEKLFLKTNETSEDRQPRRVSRERVAVESLTLAPESSVVGYKSLQQPVRGLREETLVAGVSKGDLEDAAAAIILPPNISLQVAAQEAPEGRRAAEVALPLTFAVYRNDKLFQDDEASRDLDESGRRYQVNSEVIQATFGTEVRGLREPVRIYFKPRLPGNDTKCVFWDLRARGNRGGWSEEGCRSGGREGDHHLCLCDHLTCFAELINYDQSGGFSGTHAAVLDVITVVGCSLSLLGLLLVFFTFLLFQRWRRPLSNKILVNLCLAEFCSLTVFLAGVDQTASHTLCRGVAVALHYFIMASFGWMLVEAVHQYLNFVKVVGTYIPRFMWKASVCAWGVPVLPILAVLVYDSSLYDHDGSREDGTKICWMSSTGFWVAMLPPLAATMGVNLVMYGLILYGVTCGRPSVPSTLPERALLMNQLRMAVCVFFLLGLTWLFGLLAVSSARLVFSYLFCTFTTLKGFLLFVFHVCRERGARRYWEDFLSVLKHESSVSSPGDSAHAANSAGRPGRLEASFTPCGGISVLPPLVARRPRPTTRTSLLSARSSSTPNGSRASFYP